MTFLSPPDIKGLTKLWNSNQVFNWRILTKLCLTLSWRRPLSYRNQSIDLQSKRKLKEVSHWIFFFQKKVSLRLFQAIWLLRFTSEKINLLKHILNKYPTITLREICKRMRIQISYLSNNEKEHSIFWDCFINLCHTSSALFSQL